MTGYDAVLFDNDGVLVEPPDDDSRAAAIREAFRAVGVADPERRHVEALLRDVTLGTLREVAAAYGVAPADLWDARERHDERAQQENFETGVRGTYPDVAALADVPVARGIVSNNHHSTVEFILDHFDLRGRFETYYGRPRTVDSIHLKKPNTHYVERALSDLGAESALFVGDSESDVVAARRAGLDSAFVRRPHVREADLGVAPTHEVSTLSDVAALVS